MKKRLLHLLIPLLAASSAAAADELHSLIISFHEGDSVAIVLADKPRATIHDDSLHVETADFSAPLPTSTLDGMPLPQPPSRHLPSIWCRLSIQTMQRY